MRVRSVLRRVMGTRPLTGLRAAWGVCVLMLGVPLALTAQEQTLAGTRISNVASVQYLEADGTLLNLTSTPATVEVGQVAGVDLALPGSENTRPGTTAVFPHILRNLGNGNDQFGLSTSGPPGWPVVLYGDLDRDGILSSADGVISGPISLSPGAEYPLLAAVTIPESVSPGASGTIIITAQSGFNGLITDSVQDILTAIQSPTTVSLEKSVDRSRSAPGDVVTYTVRYEIGGTGTLSGFQIVDPIPLNTVYQPGSLKRQGTHLTDATDLDSGAFEAGTNRVVFTLGNVQAGDAGSFTFQVQLQESLSQGSVILNQAQANYVDEAGADSTTTEVVGTVVASSQLALEKSVVSPDSVTNGSELTYSIVLRNHSPDITAKGLQVTDTLSDLLEVQETLPAEGLSSDGRVLTWAVPDLAPGESTTLTIRALVSAGTGTQEVPANWAYGSSTDGQVVADDSRSIPIYFPVENASATIEKQVDLDRAAPGDVLTYTLHYRIEGTGTLTNFVISDGIPPQTEFVPGTISQGSTKLTDAPDADAAIFDTSENRIFFNLGTVAGGDAGTFIFQVRLQPSVAGGTMVQNQAQADYETTHGPITVLSEVVETAVLTPELSIDKSVVAPDSVTDGDQVEYTIVLRNESSEATARNVQVFDTLPALLELQNALPAEGLSVEGRTLSWTVPDLAPGDSSVFTVSANVSATTSDEMVAANWAWFSIPSGEQGADSARAIPIFFEAPKDGSLFLALASQVLEASLGQRIPMSVSLLNDGGASLGAIEVRLDLPEGTEFVPGEILVHGNRVPSIEASPFAHAAWGGSSDPDSSGELPADSVRMRDGLVFVYPQGSLAPGDSLSFRFAMAVVSAPSSVLETRAVAQGWSIEAGVQDAPVIASNEEISWIQARRNRALETRTLIGKVWADLNENDRQDDGELGVGGVDVWTEDGEMVTTDQEGKFSFVNLRTGRHGLRVDPQTVPEGLQVSGVGPGGELTLVEVTGWISPRASFALVPSAPSVRVPQDDFEVDLPVDSVEAALLTPLRTEEDRAGDEGQNFLHGPTVEFFNPADGAVLDRDRVFVGVRGEAGQAVALFVEDSLVSEAQLRPDGVQDFISVPLSPGPQTLRARITNSWGNQRWDSLRVHVSGRPERALFTVEELPMQADGLTQYPISFRVLDAWGVPVAQTPLVTVQAQGAEIATPDADPSSMGHQVRPAADGWVTLILKAGRQVGAGRLQVETGETTTALDLSLMASVRPLMVTGVGSVSLGAGSEAFGAVTARGRLGENTSMTLSYDTRRLDQGRQEFGRSTDPLGEGQYAILGDASEKRSVNASRYAFAARVERNQDWIALGDLQTTNFAEGLTLSRYTRALPGVAARVETGPVIWKGFGALTTQTLQQAQIRGDGSSGPYPLYRGILPGTERVSIEVRALENTTRLISEQALQRFVDYQIDYVSGTLLLKTPAPATDPFGNPVFLMVTYEAEGEGSRSAVWGGRAISDLSLVSGLSGLDSVPVGITFVQDDQALGRFRLLGGDLGLRYGSSIRFQSEIVLAESPDSTDVAVQLDGAVSLFTGKLNLTGRWLKIGDEFRNPANRGLQGGTEDFMIGAGLDFRGSKISLDHQQQDFQSRGLSRAQSRLGLTQSLRGNVKLQLHLTNESVASQGLSDDGGAGQLKLTWAVHPRVNLWAQGRQQLWSEGDNLTTGDFIGTGGSLKVTSNISLEARHLRVNPTGDKDPYSITNLGVRSELASGARAWGSYQLSGGIDGPSNAAILGLSHIVRLGESWTVNTLVEKRNGVQQAALGDNVLALPFAGKEEDYWTTGLGVEHLPQDAPYRLSAKGEIRKGNTNSNQLFTVAGDVAFGGSLALLSRQELVWTERMQDTDKKESRRLWSLWGMAFRPVDSDALNALAKVEWRDSKDPGGAGVLNRQGRDRRLIATGELIWTPTRRWELSGRYSMRKATVSQASGSGMGDFSLKTTADYVGAKADFHLTPWLGIRSDVRLLNERTTGTRQWDVAPSLVVGLMGSIELQAGYRFGDLQDPDFSVRGGKGAFLTIGTKITESTISSVADFWRSRLEWIR